MKILDFQDTMVICILKDQYENGVFYEVLVIKKDFDKCDRTGIFR